MTRWLGRIAAGVILTLALVACGRGSGSQAPSPDSVYTGRVVLADVTGAVGSPGWAQDAPTFGVRPLNSASVPDEENFEVTVRFVKVGTQERVGVNYQVWQSVTFANAIMSAEQSSRGTSLSGPKAGDQVLYYNQNTRAGAAPFLSEAFVRVGQTIILIAWQRTPGFVDTKALGKVASAAANRLKDSIAGKIQPSPGPTPDPHLLAPNGPDLTLLGATVLPVDIVSQILVAPAPEVMTSFFQSAGVTNVVFGDYALSEDTRMEVVTAGMVFSSAADVPKWITANFSSSGIQNGVYLNYEQDTGQYVAAFGVGNRGVLVVCKSSQPGEQAGRSCEGPMVRLINGWMGALAAG